MKIQLDTVNKTITIEEDVNLHDFYEELNGLLPGGLWRDFTLKVEKIREWNNPITITPIDPNPSPYTNPYPQINPGIDPWTTPNNYPPQIWYTTSNSNNDLVLNTGIYNITTKA